MNTGLLRQRASSLLQRIGHADSELSVALVSDRAMRRLNRDFRGKDEPTDVLSFAMGEGEFAEVNPGGLLGDVIISVETAGRQAAARDAELGGRGYGLDEELAFLLIHGVLHLVGHDHQADAEALEMEALEGTLFAAFSLLAPRPHHVAHAD